MNELRTFLELWEIPVTRRSLEVKLEELQHIFKEEIAAHKQVAGKIDVRVFINTEMPTGPEPIQ